MEIVRKILPLVLILLGEAISVYCEIAFIKANKNNGNVFSWGIFIKMVLIMLVAVILLLLGYFFGYINIKNVWLISIISVVSILLAEPLIILSLLKEIPSKGSIIGFILAVVGLIIATFW
jgi:hypothetical protein